MANISKIKLNGTTYDVEDAKARTDVGDVTTLKTSDKSNLVKAVNEVFQSASDFKSAIAAAITGKGVTTSATASKDVMVANIKAIATGKKYASGTTFTMGTHPNAAMIYYRSLQEMDEHSRSTSGATIAINPGFAASVLKVYYVRLYGITAYYYTTVLRYNGTSFHFDCIDDVFQNEGSQELGYTCYFSNYAAPRVGNTFYLPHSHMIDAIEAVSWEAWE